MPMFSGSYGNNGSLPVWQSQQQQQQHHQQHVGTIGLSQPNGNPLSSRTGNPQQQRMDLGSFGSGGFSSQPHLPAPQMRFGGGAAASVAPPGQSASYSNNNSAGTLPMGYPSSVRVEFDSSGTIGYAGGADLSMDIQRQWQPLPTRKESTSPGLAHPHSQVVSPECSHELGDLVSLPTPISSSPNGSTSLSMFANQHSMADNNLPLASQSSTSMPHLPYPHHHQQGMYHLHQQQHHHHAGGGSSSQQLPQYSSAPPQQPPLMSIVSHQGGSSGSNGGYFISTPPAAPQQFVPHSTSVNINSPYNTFPNQPMMMNGYQPYGMVFMQQQQPQPIPIGYHHHGGSTPSTTGSNQPNGSNGSGVALPQQPRRVQPSALDHPEHSAQPPCTHNNWDNLRVKKSIMMLACRDCGSKWRRIFPPKDMCEPFHGPAQHCPAGRECPLLHVHRYKNRTRAQDDDEDGADPDGTRDVSAIASADQKPFVEVVRIATAGDIATSEVTSVEKGPVLLGGEGNPLTTKPEEEDCSPLTPTKQLEDCEAAASGADDHCDSPPLLSGSSLVAPTNISPFGN